MSYYKNNNSKKFGAIAVCFVLIGIILCGMMTSWFTDWNPYCWFGHDYDDEGICERCGYVKPADEVDQPDEDKQQSDEGGMTEVEANSEGIAIRSRKIKRSAYADEGIATQAESAQQLTAIVTPADATNKEVDWSVAWKNASSEWAIGKTVTDYVTIAATADGALTANLSCLQAFGEQVIVTVAVRSDNAISATATVDYEQRLLGVDISMMHTWASSKSAEPINWSFTTANLNPSVDFIRIYSKSNFYQNFVLGFCDKTNFTVKINEVHYSVYTKSKAITGLKISVAPTAEYLNALTAAGFTVNVNAEEYISLNSTNSMMFTFASSDLLFESFVENMSAGMKTFDQYTAMRKSLLSNVSKDMLRIKLEGLNVDERDSATIYNIKFTQSSVTPVVESITVSPDSITF